MSIKFWFLFSYPTSFSLQRLNATFIFGSQSKQDTWTTGIPCSSCWRTVQIHLQWYFFSPDFPYRYCVYPSCQPHCSISPFWWVCLFLDYCIILTASPVSHSSIIESTFLSAFKMAPCPWAEKAKRNSVNSRQSWMGDRDAGKMVKRLWMMEVLS